MSIPVARKYMACVEFDQVTEECAAVVWVDPPAVVPRLSAEQGTLIAGFIGAVWVACLVLGPIARKGASSRS